MTLSEYEVRKEKVQKLRTLGIQPYAQKFDKIYTIAALYAIEKQSKEFR